jgi:hypothetical protein
MMVPSESRSFTLARDLRQLENELLLLPQEDRAALARVLISSLDDAPDEDVPSAWVEEVHNRFAAYKLGDAPLETYDTAFSTARFALCE